MGGGHHRFGYRFSDFGFACVGIGRCPIVPGMAKQTVVWMEAPRLFGHPARSPRRLARAYVLVRGERVGIGGDDTVLDDLAVVIESDEGAVVLEGTKDQIMALFAEVINDM